MVRLFLAQPGPSVNTKFPEYNINTPLSAAMLAGQIDMVRLLLELQYDFTCEGIEHDKPYSKRFAVAVNRSLNS